MLDLFSLLQGSSSGGVPVSSGSLAPNFDSFYLLIFIAIILTLRIYRGVSGRIYSNSRVLRPPIIYLLITIIAVLGVGFIDNTILLTLALIPLGFLIGYRFSTNVNFFSRNGTVYYKRSPVIMVIWLASFLGRMALEFLFPLNLQVLLVVDSALSLTTGLIIGEAFNLMSERKNYVPQEAQTGELGDQFRFNP